jgi:hypothetical protein
MDLDSIEFIMTYAKSVQVLYLHQFSVNGFQRRTFRFLWISELFSQLLGTGRKQNTVSYRYVIRKT